MYLVSLLKNKNDIDLNTIIHKNESRTRQATRGEIAVSLHPTGKNYELINVPVGHIWKFDLEGHKNT